MQPSQTFACALNTRVSIASRVGEQDTASMIRTHIFSREEDREQDTYSLFLHESVRRRSGLSHSRSQEVRAVSRREQWCPHVPSMHATHAHTHSMRLTTSAHLPHRNQVLTAFWLRSCSHHVCSDKILRIMRHARPATRQHSIAARLRACLLDQKLAQSRFFFKSKTERSGTLERSLTFLASCSAFLKPNSDRDEQGGGASEARGHARTEHRRPERATTVAHYGEAHRTRPPSWRALPARAASSVCMLVCP